MSGLGGEDPGEGLPAKPYPCSPCSPPHPSTALQETKHQAPHPNTKISSTMGAEITLLIYSASTLQNKKRRQSEANHIYPTLQMQPSLFQGQSFGNQVTHYELCLSLKLHKERNNLTSLLSSQNKETKQRNS